MSVARNIADLIHTSGAVGIGTHSPSTLLEVNQDSSENLDIIFNNSRNQTTDRVRLVLSVDGGTTFQIENDQNLDKFKIRNASLSADVFNIFNSATHETLNITNVGVGIGTTGPTQKLNVHAADSRIEISTDSAGTTKTQLQFTTDRDGTPGYGFMGLLHNNGSRLLRIGTNGNSGTDYGIQLDANNNVDIRGNVGIGTDNPSTILHLAGDASPTITLTSSSGPRSYIESNTVGSVGIAADESNTGTSSNINFRVDGAERMRIYDSGDISIKGANGNNNFYWDASDSYNNGQLKLGTGTGVSVEAMLAVSRNYGDINNPLVHFDITGNDGRVLRVSSDTSRTDMQIFDVINNNGTAFAVRGDGNVGIGTNNPGANLTLNGGSTTTQTFKSSWSSGTGRIAFIGGSSSGVDGSSATSTAAKIESLATAPGGAATGDLKLIVNSGDSFVTGIEIVPDGAVRLALQGTHTTIGSYDDPRAPYGWNNITTNNHADVLWGLNSRLIGSGTGHDFEVVSSHYSLNHCGIMFTGNGNPTSPNNILFFSGSGSGTAGSVVASTDAKFTMNSGGSFVTENGSSGAVIRLDNIGNSGTSNHYIELSSNLPGYANGKYNCLKTNFGDLHFVAGGAYTGYISTNSGFVDVSDQSLKENVVTIDNALDKVLQLEGRYFTWINENQSDDRQIGFIAQEVEAVVPELVTTSDTGIKGMSYGKATALLVEAIKEQQATIQALQDRLDAAGIA